MKKKDIEVIVFHINDRKWWRYMIKVWPSHAVLPSLAAGNILFFVYALIAIALSKCITWYFFWRGTWGSITRLTSLQTSFAYGFLGLSLQIVVVILDTSFLVKFTATWTLWTDNRPCFNADP